MTLPIKSLTPTTHFAIYDHTIISDTHKLSTYRAIVIKNSDGHVIAFTGLELFSTPYTGRTPTADFRFKHELIYICHTLNYIFAHNHIRRITDITVEMLIGFLREYAQTPKTPGTQLFRSKQSVEKCLWHICNFFANLSVVFPMKLCAEDVLQTTYSKRNPKSPRVEQIYVPRLPVKAETGHRILLLRDIPEEAAWRLVELAHIHDPMIAFAIAYADLWLYIALHMFAAIRSTDCTALSAPPLPCHPNEVLRQIQCGTFSEQAAYKIAFSFIHQVTALQMRPHKTKDTGLSADLYISCPESCIPAFGRIVAIASAHQIISQSSQLVQPVTDLHTIRSFFGPVFANACGNKDFSGRRANKALMQAVKTQAEESGHTPLLAYMLASRMRSHRGSYDSIAPTTAIYLRNSSFSNLTADDIAYLLMERGVCSFATDYMMQTCYGEKYTQLSAFSQTEAIRSIGCHVSHLDKTMRHVQYAMDDAIKTVNAVVQQKPMKDVLATLALGCAPGKEQGSMCMCKAADMQCQEPSRLNCLGCKYEVKTKALLVKYIIAYNEMWADIDGLLETDIQRKRWLANHIYAPAISEIQAHLLNAQTDMRVYNQLVLEVSENAGTKNRA